MLEVSSKLSYPISRGLEESVKPRVTFATTFEQNHHVDSSVVVVPCKQAFQTSSPLSSPTKEISGQMTHEGFRAVEELNNQALVKCGYLLKRSTKRKVWKKRWFVLRGTSLTCYKDDKEYELERIIDLSEAIQILEATWKTRKNVFGIVVSKKKYYFQAESRIQLDEWLNTMDYVLSGLTEEDVTGEYSHSRKSSAGSRSSIINRSNSDPPKEYFLSYGKAESTPRNLARIPSYSRTSENTSSEDDEEQGEIVDEDDEVELPECQDNKVLFSGYLHKQCDMYKAWRKRWFVLRSNTLSYYKNEKEYVLHKIIPIESIQGAFEKTPSAFKSKRFCFQLITPQRNYIVAAENQPSMLAWLRSINSTVARANSEVLDV
ncbi:PH domain-like protein [Basidiobolus meristosporus CBS 931.73]|uniref:PH domain-like protein n=1 Tax=Basidiobolus meristosporus CBS 931.73 TaxID=1314790 RepID=A0A1Y1Z2V6_9FUNG|nr:PH domain-like protein [Basidiobolus meristosporus CBS 931.73]|eukprot:ORY04620.1 PH domain-like protein [Basidiobolus meristosporus CBS 931.73]